jgi:Ca2+/Na+ antiporter
MKFDNKSEYERLRGQLAIITIIFSTFIGIGILYDIYEKYLFPWPSWIYSIFFVFLFILYLIYRYKKRYQIIIYDDEESPQHIIIKFYSMTSFIPKYNMIKIPKNSLYKIQIQKSFYNKREELIIFQKLKEGIAKYRPISLTGLNNQTKTLLIQTLDSFAKQKIFSEDDK